MNIKALCVLVLLALPALAYKKMNTCFAHNYLPCREDAIPTAEMINVHIDNAFKRNIYPFIGLRVFLEVEAQIWDAAYEKTVWLDVCLWGRYQSFGEKEGVIYSASHIMLPKGQTSEVKDLWGRSSFGGGVIYSASHIMLPKGQTSEVEDFVFADEIMQLASAGPGWCKSDPADAQLLLYRIYYGRGASIFTDSDLPHLHQLAKVGR